MKKLAGLLAATAALVCASPELAAEELENLVVSAGEEVTIDSQRTYGTVTVNGSLTVKDGGNVKAYEVRVADGKGATGTLTLDGGYLEVGKTGDYETPYSLYIGYNGGVGKVVVNSRSHSIRNVVLGHGGADGCLLQLVSGGIIGASVRKSGDGESSIEFSGGRLELSGFDFIAAEKGRLRLKSMSGSAHIQIRLRRDGHGYLFDSDAAHTGTVETEGAGSVYLFSSAQKEEGVLILNSLPDGRLSWGHTGGFLIYGNESNNVRVFGRVRMGDGDFFSHGILQTVKMYDNQSLDVNGKSVKMKELLFVDEQKGGPARIWNSASSSGEVVLGTDAANKVSVVKDCTWERNVKLVKTSSSTLRLDFREFYAPIRVNGGTLAVTNEIAVSNIAQTADGKIYLGEAGIVRFNGETWENPAFTDDSRGTVVSCAAAGTTNRMTAGAIAFKGGLKVESGTLQLGKTGSVTDRFYRFTIRRSYVATPAIVDLSELRLLDAQGNNLSLALTGVKAGTPAKDLLPGSCAYAAAYTEGWEHYLSHLFDGDTNTTMHVKDIAHAGENGNYMFNAPITVHFRLREGAAAVSYQMWKGSSPNTSRNPTRWSLESSPDGIRWELLDERVQEKYEQQTLESHAPFKNGPFVFQHAFGNLDSLDFPETAKVAIAAGAMLDARASSGGIAALSVDAADYAQGSCVISYFPAAANGKIYLENFTLGNGRVHLPVDVGYLYGDIASWRAVVDGRERPECSLAHERSGALALKCAPFGIIIR